MTHLIIYTNERGPLTGAFFQCGPHIPMSFRPVLCATMSYSPVRLVETLTPLITAMERGLKQLTKQCLSTRRHLAHM